MKHIKISINGIVQGIGFRPFIYRTAKHLDLLGWVKNSTKGVIISVQGTEKNLFKFIDTILYNSPQLSKIEFFKVQEIENFNFDCFEIIDSDENNNSLTLISTDIATCTECECELLDSNNERRLKYPFNNCTNCGPRYTIIKKLPYDRKSTSMSKFKMCINCVKEYRDPLDRRFHAEPIGCNNCGPKLCLLDKSGVINTGDSAVKLVSDYLAEGKIIALKGVGGYNIICDGNNITTVNKLRNIKNRGSKPLAVMFKNLTLCKKICAISSKEEEILTGNKKPILLLNKIDPISHMYISNTNTLGVLLPYSPLHYLIFNDNLEFVIFTSGNTNGKPINYTNKSHEELLSICDYILTHDRDINVPIDDSIVKVNNENVQVIRPGRGYYPFFKRNTSLINKTILAIGSQLKNTFSLSIQNQILTSPYNGNLLYKENLDNYNNVLNNLINLYNLSIDTIIEEYNPYKLKDNLTIKYTNLIRVYHHHAHIVSCMIENNISENVIGIAFDGTGYGSDNCIWGGEFLLASLKNFHRLGHLEYFYLIGGESAIKSPWKIAYELCTKSNINPNIYLQYFSNYSTDISILKSLKDNDINCYKTSSIGRLFDGLSYLLGFHKDVEYEAEASIFLEQLALKSITTEYYKFSVSKQNTYVILLAEIIDGVLTDLINNVPKYDISRKFHNTIIKFTSYLINKLSLEIQISKVVLGGGVFQNDILSYGIVNAFKNTNIDIYTNKLIPTNDSGISFGQIHIGIENMKVVQCNE